jgi:hypothetical protein
MQPGSPRARLPRCISPAAALASRAPPLPLPRPCPARVSGKSSPRAAWPCCRTTGSPRGSCPGRSRKRPPRPPSLRSGWGVQRVLGRGADLRGAPCLRACGGGGVVRRCGGASGGGGGALGPPGAPRRRAASAPARRCAEPHGAGCQRCTTARGPCAGAATCRQRRQRHNTPRQSGCRPPPAPTPPTPARCPSRSPPGLQRRPGAGPRCAQRNTHHTNRLLYSRRGAGGAGARARRRLRREPNKTARVRARPAARQPGGTAWHKIAPCRPPHRGSPPGSAPFIRCSGRSGLVGLALAPHLSPRRLRAPSRPSAKAPARAGSCVGGFAPGTLLFRLPLPTRLADPSSAFQAVARRDRRRRL